MHKHRKMVLFLVFWAALGLLGGALSLHMAGDGRLNFLPEAQGDALFTTVGLPEAWQEPVDWQLSASLPGLLAVCGEDSVEPASGSSSWAYYADSFSRQKGLMTTRQASGMHPLEAQEQGLLPILLTNSEAEGLPPLQLFWQREPQELKVVIYDYSWWHTYGAESYGLNRAPSEELQPASDGSYHLPEDGHSYVFEIEAKWHTGDNGLGGEARLSFFLPGELN